MENSIHLFTVRGIAIRVHVTFPLILIWGALQFGPLSGRGLNGAVFGLIVTLLLFVVVVLHELGHSVAAQYYGVKVKRIVLLPIGGVAELERIPEEPIKEFVIAIAGPLVNFGLAILLTGAAFVFDIGLVLGGPQSMLRHLSALNPEGYFGYVYSANLFLGVFNLLPAFPMDGGRVLRAILASRMEHARATRIAATIGQGLALLLGLWGFLGGGFFTILVAIFIYLGAGQEGWQSQVRSALRGLTVAQGYSRRAQTVRPDSTLQEVVNLTLSSFQSDFAVCDQKKVVGLMTHTRLIEALQAHGPDLPVGQVMQKDVRPVRPQDPLFDVQQRLQSEMLDALPVTDGDEFLGLITLRDINELFRLITSQPDLVIAPGRG